MNAWFAIPPNATCFAAVMFLRPLDVPYGYDVGVWWAFVFMLGFTCRMCFESHQAKSGG